MAGITRMPDRATISTPAPVSPTVHNGPPGNRHQTKASTGAIVLLQSGGRTRISGHQQPRNHSNYEGQRDRWNGYRRRIRGKCHQQKNPRHLGHPGIPCPFWLRMADTSSVRPTGLIRDLDVTIKGHAFRIYAVMLQLNVQGAYPLLRVRPWLRTAHIKHNWQKNIITFWRGKTKVRVATQPRATTAESHYSRLH